MSTPSDGEEVFDIVGTDYKEFECPGFDKCKRSNRLFDEWKDDIVSIEDQVVIAQVRKCRFCKKAYIDPVVFFLPGSR